MAIKVLVVDDSAIIRKVVSDILNADSDIEVVSTAPSGEIALAKAESLKPDVITLDIEMPGIGGLETLKKLSQNMPDVKVIMVSAHTESGANVTLDALAHGAFDYVTKPSSSGEGQNKEEFARKIVDKVKATKRKICRRTISKEPAISTCKKTGTEIKLTTIGISTGGPQALAKMLPEIPEDYPTPILIVQHMPPMFTKLLADRLNESCKLNVMEAEDNMYATPGNIYIAPGDYHLSLINKNDQYLIELNQDPPENSCRPAADVLFRTAAAACDGDMLAVVMTGMGKDGFEGAKVVKSHGGTVICQDEASCVIWGMPAYVYENNLADGIFPLHKLAHAMLNICKNEE